MSPRNFIWDLLWYGNRILKVSYSIQNDCWIVILSADTITLTQTHIYSLEN
jgi:hypothetical protein